MTAPPDLSAGTCTTVIGFAEASVYEQAQVCRSGCPVLVECLEFGIATPPELRAPGVVWGAARLELERLQGMPRWQVTPTPRKEKP
jgi:hypothetical protein